MSFIGDQPLELTCPGCGEKVQKTWGWLKDEPKSFECPGCGETVALDYSQPGELTDAIDGINESVEDLKKTLRDINKRMK